MNGRSIWRGGVDQLARAKIEEDALRAAHMAGIAMGQDKAVEPIHPAGPKIFTEDAIIITGGAGVEKPVAAPRCECARRRPISDRAH